MIKIIFIVIRNSALNFDKESTGGEDHWVPIDFFLNGPNTFFLRWYFETFASMWKTLSLWWNWGFNLKKKVLSKTEANI